MQPLLAAVPRQAWQPPLLLSDADAGIAGGFFWRCLQTPKQGVGQLRLEHSALRSSRRQQPNFAPLTEHMPNQLSDRQTLAAIALTLVVVIGLVLLTVKPEQEREPGLIWRDQPDQPTKSLAI